MIKYLQLISVTLIISCNSLKKPSSITVVGQMKDVMWKGELEGKVSTDTINSSDAYGLGPIEFLKGEILLFEGKTFISSVIDSSEHKVIQTNSVKAPFLVFSKNSNLRKVKFPNKNFTLNSLENFIDSIYMEYDEPLLVRIDGVFDNITIHSVNLADGSIVKSPNDAHEGLIKYNYNNKSGSIIGFFSRKHKTIFTHHDSYLHAHFISNDRSILGHLDALSFDSKKSLLQISK